ncbi:MAG TPA: DNA-3-methyladenine glycosylase [Bacillota bacterium]|nr:DNA-3-methyladenine glycosylase [Bacillota bacterium]
MHTISIKQNDERVIQLAKVDPLMGRLIHIIGDVHIIMRPNFFQSLVRSIIGQQISVAAANSIYNHLKALVGKTLTPENISALSDNDLRHVGFSKQKIRYVRDLTVKIRSATLNLNILPSLNNKDAVKQLTKTKGIGKWTAEMFLIFSLGRMDVLSLDDIGIQRGAQWLYQVDRRERRNILIKMADVWHPHYTIASVYLWEAVRLDLINQYTNITEAETAIY